MTVAPLSRIAMLLLVGALCTPFAATAQTTDPTATPAAKPAKPKPKPAATTAAPAATAAAVTPAMAAKPAAAKPAAKPAPATAQAAKPVAPIPGGGDSQPTLLGQYGDWGAYSATPGGKKVCFALAKPKSSLTTPAGRPRDSAFLFISTRPAEKVHAEVSVIIGYPFKPATEATAEIGPTSFAMYTQNDGAWIKNVADEARMLDSMRKGGDLVVKGTSGRGTQSSDTFSLKGMAQALDRTDQECK